MTICNHFGCLLALFIFIFFSVKSELNDMKTDYITRCKKEVLIIIIHEIANDVKKNCFEKYFLSKYGISILRLDLCTTV